MYNFMQFLIERGPISSRGTLNAKAGSPAGERHHSKYYGPEGMDKHGKDWMLSTDHKPAGLQAGDNVRLSGVRNVNGSYHGIHHDDQGNEHQIPMSKFYKPSTGRVGKDQEAAEAEQVKMIQSSINDAKGKSPYMRLHVGGGNFVNVAGVTRVTKELANEFGHKGAKPKADIFLHDEHGRPVSWHSLKAAGGFQQLGGVQDHQKNGENHPEIQKMINKFKNHKNKEGYDTIPEGLMYHHDLDERDPEHRAIIMRSMYGKDHGKKDFGVNNVNSIVKGGMHFQPAAVKDPEGRQHARVPSMDLSPFTHQHVSTNDDRSEIIPSKLVLRRDGISNQEGTGGRLMLISKDNHNYKNSVDINSSKGVAGDLKAHHKKIQDAAAERKRQTELRRQERSAARKSAPPAALNMPAMGKKPRVSKTKQPIISDGHGEHGGASFNGPSEQPE